MPTQQGIGGRHRRRKERATVLTAVPVALAVAWGGTAQAAPQDFVTAPDTAQSGTTDATPVPVPTSQRDFPAGFTPSPRVQQSQWRTQEDYRAGRPQAQTAYTAPVQSAPAPQAQPPVAPAPFVPPTPPPPPTVQRTVIAPIEVPDGEIGLGAGSVPYDKNLIDPNVVEQYNNASRALQADGANALVDAGLADVPQADRVAAGAATGIVVGGAIGAAALGVPATAVGAVGGGLVGLGIGAATVPFVWWAPGIGWVFGPGVGAAIGAGVGAAALGVPAAVVGAGIGGAIGGAIGATALGGEQTTITEPAPAAPAPATEAAPVWTPPQDLAPVVDSAPAYVEQARTAVAEQPGGAAVLDAVDTAVADAAPVIEQGTAALNAALAPLGVAV